jgi:hypothetical protein
MKKFASTKMAEERGGLKKKTGQVARERKRAKKLFFFLSSPTRASDLPPTLTCKLAPK